MAKRSKPSPVTWAGRGMVALFSVAALSQAKLQTVERGHTIDLAKATNRFTLSAIDKAKRGVILDANGKALAVDEDAYELNVRFDQVPHSDAFFMDLSEATGIPASEFSTLAAGDGKSRVWKEPISSAQAASVQALREQWRCGGVSLKSTGRRSYPLGQDASCVLGLVRDGKAIMGLEASKNSLLCGVDGKKIGLTDRNGSFLPMRLEGDTLPRKDGDPITLTIDSDLQSQAATAIRKGVELNKADDGVAIVIDPSNGDILAMANWPSFSPYNPDGTDSDLSKSTGFNPATMGVLEPGSTFKILTLAKALDCGKAHLDEVINCSGELHINNAWRIRCDDHHGNRAHGPVNAMKAIAKSCNVSAATWALRVGRPDFLKYVEDLGLLKKPRLGMPSESIGLFNYNEYAKPLQLATVGFGQSITTTPIALAGAFAMIGNEGKLIAPRLIKRIGNRDIPARAPLQIVKPETANTVLQCMEAVIQSDAGTGKTLRIPGYRLAGKTGTAQKIGSHQTGYVSNFVGFVPAVHPKALVLVMVNHPTAGEYHGATVAGPVFESIARSVIHHFEIAPTEPVTQAQLLKEQKKHG